MANRHRLSSKLYDSRRPNLARVSVTMATARPGQHDQPRQRPPAVQRHCHVSQPDSCESLWPCTAEYFWTTEHRRLHIHRGSDQCEWPSNVKWRRRSYWLLLRQPDFSRDTKFHHGVSARRNIWECGAMPDINWNRNSMGKLRIAWRNSNSECRYWSWHRTDFNTFGWKQR